MDIWITAVAAGAGYIAQHWKDLKGGGKCTSESPPGSSNSVKPDPSQQPLDKKFPFRRLVLREKLGEEVFEGKGEVCEDVHMGEVTSTSEFDGEKFGSVGNYEGSHVFSTSSVSWPGLIGSDGLQEDEEGLRSREGIGDLLLKPSTEEIGPSYCSPRTRRVLRSRRMNGRLMRPLSSLESCLMTQLYKEHVEMEEYINSSIPTPSTWIVRPFFVTDGSKVISRASSDSFMVQNRTVENKRHKETYSEDNGTVSGVPPLPNIGSLDRRKMKVNTGSERCGTLSISSKRAIGKHFNLPRGSSHGALLLCLGISFGIVSSFVANRREVDKLNELLKQTENLVQDLQEELEMKDSLTVKELAVEDYESQDVHEDFFNRTSHSFFHGHILDKSTIYDNKENPNQKGQESLSKIEAELEAELEMLELNMNSTTLERKLSNLVELDPDFVPDIAHGELKTNIFPRPAGDQPYADRDGSGSSTSHSANYAVSPRELSLRLHEVIQSRLEERIKELEAAVENNQRKKVQSWRDLSSSEAGESSSIQGSPIHKEERDLADEPVVLNLSGEALDAYNEAYDEFTKMDELEDEDLPSEVGNSDHGENLETDDQNLYHFQNGGVNHYMLHHPVNNGMSIDRRDEDDVSQNGNQTSRDENEIDEDEMEKLLIKHIVEKAKKGSPVVLNAQRALFAMD